MAVRLVHHEAFPSREHAGIKDGVQVLRARDARSAPTIGNDDANK